MNNAKRTFTLSLLVLIALIAGACRAGPATATRSITNTRSVQATKTPAALKASTPFRVSPTALVSLFPTFTVAPDDTPTPLPQVEIQHGKITSQALAGNLLGDPRTRDYYVLLPPSYASSQKRYPVLYMLHQFGGTADTYVPAIQRAYESALSKGEIQEMIVAFPDASNKLGGSWYHSSPTIGDYETYLTREFVDLIDATYRTIPDRQSRGVTGCSMGGIGAIHFGFKYPQVFSVAVGVSGYYDKKLDPLLAAGARRFTAPPKDLQTLKGLVNPIQIEIAEAAGAAPNPQKPPFFLDMPYQVVNGKTQVVQSVIQKEIAQDPLHDATNYVNQALRLRGVMIYHGKEDPLLPIETARAFDQELTALGVPHDYLEVDGHHCDLDFEPVLKFVSDTLVFSSVATPLP